MNRGTEGTPNSLFSREEIIILIYDKSYFKRLVDWLRGHFNKYTVFLFFFFLLGSIIFVAFREDGIVKPANVGLWSSMLYPRVSGVYFFSDWYRLLLVFVINPVLFSSLARLYNDLPDIFETVLSEVTSSNDKEIRKKFDELRRERSRKRNALAAFACIVLTVLVFTWVLVWESQKQPFGFYSLNIWSTSKMVTLVYNCFVVFLFSYSIIQLHGTFYHYHELLALVVRRSPEETRNDLRNAVHKYSLPYRKIFYVVAACLIFSVVIKNALVPLAQQTFDWGPFLKLNYNPILYYLAILLASGVIYLLLKRRNNRCFEIEPKKRRPWRLAALFFALVLMGVFLIYRVVEYLRLTGNWEYLYMLLFFVPFWGSYWVVKKIWRIRP